MIQGMIIASIVAGSALIMGRLLIDQKLIQKGAESRDQIEDVNDVIFGILQDKENCQKTIEQNNLKASFDLSGTYSLNEIWSKDALVFNSGGRYLAENVIIQSITLVTSSNLGTAQLYVVFEILDEDKGTKRGVAAKRIRKSIELRVQKKTEDGSFSSCYAFTKGQSDQMNETSSLEVGNDLSKEFCLEMNAGSSGSQKAFIWDDVNSVCKPNFECSDKKIFVGIDAFGTVLCKKIEEWVNFNNILDSSAVDCPIGKNIGFKIDNATKKVSIQCSP